MRCTASGKPRLSHKNKCLSLARPPLPPNFMNTMNTPSQPTSARDSSRPSRLKAPRHFNVTVNISRHNPYYNTFDLIRDRGGQWTHNEALFSSLLQISHLSAARYQKGHIIIPGGGGREGGKANYKPPLLPASGASALHTGKELTCRSETLSLFLDILQHRLSSFSGTCQTWTIFISF